MYQPSRRIDRKHSGSSTESSLPLASQTKVAPSPNGRRPRIALYSHDTVGLGHLRRNVLIAMALSRSPLNADVLILSGAREACHFAMSCGIDCVTVPSLSKTDGGEYQGRFLPWDLDQTAQLRSQVISAALVGFQPDLLIVDKVPRGVGNELDDVLVRVRNDFHTRCVLGLREILDEPERVNREWVHSQSDQAIEKLYDEVWVYGDPAVFNPLQQYDFGASTRERAYLVGYLDQRLRLQWQAGARSPQSLRDGSAGPRVVCTVGGGQDGARLAAAFAATDLPNDWRGWLITGPYMHGDERKQLRELAGKQPRLTLVEDLVEADAMIANADRVVCMGGYNTISSILSFEKPSLVVPRIAPRREQWIRARCLADRGIVSMLEPDMVTPESISQWLRKVQPPTPSRRDVNLNGLANIARRAQALLGLPTKFTDSISCPESSLVQT